MESAETSVRAARHQLATQRAAMHAELAKIEQAITALDALLTPDSADTGTSRRTIRVRTRTPIRKPIVEIMKERSGEHLHASDVVEALRARGTPMEQASPVNTVGTALGRLAKKGLVVAHGSNVYSWAASAHDDDDNEEGDPFASDEPAERTFALNGA